MNLTCRETKLVTEGLTVAALIYERDRREDEAKLCRAAAHVLREGGVVVGEAW